MLFCVGLRKQNGHFNILLECTWKYAYRKVNTGEVYSLMNFHILNTHVTSTHTITPKPLLCPFPIKKLPMVAPILTSISID